MSGGGFPVELILVAMVAAILVLRLRSVLGRRTGFERPPQAEARPANFDPRSATRPAEPAAADGLPPPATARPSGRCSPTTPMPASRAPSPPASRPGNASAARSAASLRWGSRPPTFAAMSPM